MATLYHYCTTNTFAAIVRERSIRLSSLNLSNDTMEGRLASHILREMVSARGGGLEAFSRIKEIMEYVERILHGFGFCLSSEGDLLSQWRGYADDAHGVSIGFDQDAMANLGGAELSAVSYTREEQETMLSPLVDDVLSNAEESALLDKVLELLDKMFLMKSPAFAEEKEWRLITSSSLGVGGWDVCPRRSSLVPFRELGINDGVITQVVLGPKHQTPVDVVQRSLLKWGFNGVTVVRSKATYR